MDIFDEGICDDILAEDWAKVERSRRADGYKEGIAQGQESCLQQSFNSGFSQGTEASFSRSFIKGTISALISMLHLKEQDVNDAENTEAVKDLESIMHDLDSLQFDVTKGCCSSGEVITSSSKDGLKRKEEDQTDKKTTCCLDYDTSQSDSPGSSSKCIRDENSEEVAGGKSTSSIMINAAENSEEHLFYSQSRNQELNKIVQRLKPHLQRTKCEHILSVSHQFL
ncbi:uncharacterized protein LOC121426762 [Lytechinus variegatus]|uniref:uncharacterized protein LOC121426762 n=1 Tax=Lytechinus variegatus TaxID=7654 RepID=UPI001BB2CA64|nr:uncharacterized protein LOC121426762 [Lytechinus variegatus]